MIIYICNNSHTYVWNQHIPYGAWYGQDEKSWWFCTAHGKNEDKSLTLYRYNGTQWIKTHERSNTTLKIYAWAEHHDLWWTKCHWFKEEDKQKSLVAKHDSHMKKYENMMKAERKHKKGSNGIRLDKENYYADKLIIDYECSKKPLHDFQRFYN